MNIDHLKSLVTAAKSSEHLYEEQTAAMVFATVYGERLIDVVEAGQAMQRDIRKHNRFAHFDNMVSEIGSKAWDAATKGDEP